MTAAPDPDARTKVFVHLPHGVHAQSYREKFEQGLVPDASPYGFHQAEAFGFDVRFAQDRLSGWGQRISAISRRRLHLDVAHSFANRKAMAAADVIWTMNEWDAIGARLLMALRIVPHRPIVGTAIWIVDWWDKLPVWQRALYAPLIRRIDLLLLHTKPCFAACRRKLPTVRSRLMHFGIATDTFAPVTWSEDSKSDAGEPIRIVAAGNDPTRDWPTLLEAFGNQPGYELVIINQEIPDVLIARYRNLTVPRRPSMQDFRRLYASATYIAVPMRENIYSGITVALEAMAIGVPVIATRTGGVPTYMAEGEALFVPVGDAEAWRTASRSQTRAERRAMAERAHARFHRDDYSTKGMMRRFANFTAPLLGHKADGRNDD